MFRLLALLLCSWFPLPGCQSEGGGWSWHEGSGLADPGVSDPPATGRMDGSIDLPPGVRPLARAPVAGRGARVAGGAARGLSPVAPSIDAADLPEVVIDGRTYIYGAKFEPPKGRVMVGMGQFQQGNDAYLAAIPGPRLQPANRLYFLAVGDWPRPWESRLANMARLLRQEQAAGRIPDFSLGLFGIDPETQREAAIDHEIARGVPRYDERIAQTARMLRDLGGPVFVRPGSEFNGDWSGQHPYEYPKAFRRIVEIFRREGAENCAFSWGYEPSAPDDFDVVDEAGPRWFPGDDVIDWYGLDVFETSDFLGSPGRNGVSSPAGRAERFLEMARVHGKPVLLDEVSASRVGITADRDDGRRAWKEWFEPFFDFLDRHPEIRGFNYINQDWSRIDNYARMGWKDARLTNNAFISQKWFEELSRPRYLHAPDVPLLNGYDASLRTQRPLEQDARSARRQAPSR